MRKFAALILISLALGACANDGLRDLRNASDGPDEFLVEPVNPLQAPDNFDALPEPTPGAANRTDKYPRQEGIIALGGRPQSADAPIPASETALVRQASRFGVTPGIRQVTAQADAEYRRKQGRFTQFRIAPTDLYNRAYRKQTLDSRREALRWRRAGARTPAFPPEG